MTAPSTAPAERPFRPEAVEQLAAMLHGDDACADFLGMLQLALLDLEVEDAYAGSSGSPEAMRRALLYVAVSNSLADCFRPWIDMLDDAGRLELCDSIKKERLSQ